ncbi:hypothetical protein LUZ60_012692 [Juncus effusus]|nr:hypothetical protein LUZ60_012692 [Juncus effusus]
MALRSPNALLTLTLVLWLTFLILSLHAWNSINHQPNFVSRKLLFSPRNLTREAHHHHNHHHKNHHKHDNSASYLPGHRPKPGPDPGEEIDPRYGVDKRLVPTGPNPLHH